MITVQDAIRLYEYLVSRGIPVWVIGGWGIDALLGEQTRPHKDLDVLVLADDVARLCALLGRGGYSLKELWSENCSTVDVSGREIPTAFVLHDAEGRELDVHAIRLDGQGNGIPAWEGATFIFKGEDIAGEGTIGGVVVRCVTAGMQMVCHTGYELPDEHRRDVERLHQKFGMEMHSQYGGGGEVTVSDQVRCSGFPCTDVRHECFAVPAIDVDPAKVAIMLISEAAPANPGDYYYAGGESLFEQTTVQAFRDAGAQVSSVQDILGLGVYLTTAVKCGKTGYGIQTATIQTCSLLLEKEIALFPNVRVFLLMGDVAIKAVNHVAKRAGEGRVIPAGSTYKIRGQEFFFRGRRAFPSYVQAGPSFFIEKSKRKAIAQDIAAALALVS